MLAQSGLTPVGLIYEVFSYCDKTLRDGIGYTRVSFADEFAFVNPYFEKTMKNSGSYTLGLDLGSSSIGWAIVDDEGRQIVAAGVRVFPEGVGRDKQGGELSKNEARRKARGMRRQTIRRACRKRRLRQALVKTGLLPEVALLPRYDERRVEWEREQFRLDDPYALRACALTERLDPFEIGRVFLHLGQRRGFLSNRKTDRANKKESSDLLAEINALASELGERTLGQYLDALQASDSQARLRGWHTRRDMYEREFEAIWTAQQRHHPNLLTEKLKYGSAGRQSYPCKPQKRDASDLVERHGLHGLIFFQRPMYWPKSVVGQCELEPKQRRCPRADRVAQRCRLLQEVNNLRLLDTSSAEERPLRQEERELLLRYLERSKEKKFDDIRKEFCRKLSVPETILFNLERGERKKMDGMPTDALLAKKDLFGSKWHDRPEEEKDRIVRALLDDEKTDAVHEEEIYRLADTEWGIDRATAERLLDVDFPTGYASFSRVALEKLRPHLERGLLLMTRDGTPSALAEAGYLRPDQREVNQKEYLPKPPRLTNPLVRQALYEVRRLVNAILREYGMPKRIHIELAREVKGTAIDRARRTHDMRKREWTRDDAAEEIRKIGVKVTRDAIDRYILWEEQRRECIYSGRAISQVQLFGGEIDVDHILPRGRSLDNSLMNRVVCFRAENADKRDRTPHEWLAATNPGKYEAVLQRTKCLPYPKAQRFRQAHLELDDFFARQFVDTTYITTQVHQYVRCLGTDLLCSKGMHTADLRHHWGLNTVLRTDERDQKNRDDHRHHAVDAIVIALTDRSRLQLLAGLYKRGRQEGEVLPEPWPHFRDAVETAVNAINVSHRVQRKVRGALHEETIYGPTQKSNRQRDGERPWAKEWIEQPEHFVYRKPLETLTLAEVEHIRDERVRELVIERLQRHGITAGRKKRGKSGEEEASSAKGIPKEVWKEPLYLTPRKGKSSARPAVIKTVRVVKKEGTIRPIRGGSAYVKPGSIHHLCIFEFTDERGRRKREAKFVSMLEAAQRKKEHKPIVQRIHPERPNARFVMSLSRGEMVFGTFKGKEQLVRLITSVSTERKMSFAPHTDARPSKELTKYSVNANTLNARKVIVDVLGRLRWAND
jgi:CRISPR-associated endonuclease Csn1